MKSDPTIYGVYWQRRNAAWHLSLYKKDGISPDLVLIKQLEIESLDYVLNDLVKKLC